LAALLAQLNVLAARQPVYVIFEDVHWADPTSLELLTVTLERIPRLRVLLLITARREFKPPWPGHAHVTTVSLTRLSRRDGAALIERVTGGKTLPEEGTGPNPRPYRWRAPVRRGTDQDGARNRAFTGTGRSLRPQPSAALDGNSDDIARIANGEARPIGVGEGGGSDRRCGGSRVLLRTTEHRGWVA